MTREPDISLSSERLLQCQEALGQLQQARAEIERLKAEVASLQASSGYEASIAQVEIERLKTALTPFALNVDAISLRDALGHIEREHLLEARAALEPKP